LKNSLFGAIIIAMSFKLLLKERDYECHVVVTKHSGKPAYPYEAGLEMLDKTLDKYNSSADSTTPSLDRTASASLTT
jgi:hypothetical protein